MYVCAARLERGGMRTCICACEKRGFNMKSPYYLPLVRWSHIEHMCLYMWQNIYYVLSCHSCKTERMNIGQHSLNL